MQAPNGRLRVWRKAGVDFPNFLREEVSCFWKGIASDACTDLLPVPIPALAGRYVLDILDGHVFLFARVGCFANA